MRTLRNLFIDELASRYDGERRTALAMPKMMAAARCPGLQDLFGSHLRETLGHVKTVERVFSSLGEKPRTKRCDAAIGLLREADDAALENKRSPAIDAALVCSAQKLKHYEIAAYGSLRAWAALLGNPEMARLLHQALAEEQAAVQALSVLARSRCDNEALGQCSVSIFNGDELDPGLLNARPAIRPAARELTLLASPEN